MMKRARILALVLASTVGCTGPEAPLAQQGRPLGLSNGMVISQIYGAGGNSGAKYTHDYVELFNRGAQAVSMGGWSVQYG